MTATPVVFVLSGNYAGSHLLASLLGAHGACADIGELRNLPRFRRRTGGNDSGTESAYPDSALFAGLESLPVADWHATVLARLQAEDRRLQVLVDNSKRIDWVRRLSREADLDVRCVHLLRDPRALVRRWRSMAATRAARRRNRWREIRRQWRRAGWLLRASEVEVLALRWLRENRAISDLLAGPLASAPVVTYEELVGAPEQTLRSLMPALGLDYEPGQLDPARIRSHGTRKTDWSQVSGTLRPDLRWQQDLTAAEAEAVVALAPLDEYLAGLGYGFGPDGLQARSAVASAAAGEP